MKNIVIPPNTGIYEIDLPDGAVLEQSDQGTVFVLAQLRLLWKMNR